ncbi:hypothetical protein ACFV4F_13590 [Kitasatospora sp. NPDC059722]|uniref:hypothetical protein n=1 Tax=Kitasatospora sp. NPDC059722 TaxID=3346925 RepID=UPI003675E680
MTIPPPPTFPPTVGMPDAEPEPLDPRKTEPTDTDDDDEDQAVEDDDQDQADADQERYDLRTVAESLRLLISQTPEEQAERARREREEKFREQGETPDKREDRHRAEQLVQKRRASVLWRQPQSERARRFRRWCILTTTSAVLGYQMGAVQLAAHMPLTVAALAAAGAWLIDLRMRGWGHVRVSEVRGFPGLTILILLRVPFASALVGALGLAPLITLLSTSHH